MTRSEAKGLLPIIEAFANGAAIEFTDRDGKRWVFSKPDDVLYFTLPPKYWKIIKEEDDPK